jgi:hypothetical protein
MMCAFALCMCGPGPATIGHKGSVQDFLCMTFVDDSPPLMLYDAEGKRLVEAPEGATDHTTSRVVVGTRDGDLVTCP